MGIYCSMAALWIGFLAAACVSAPPVQTSNPAAAQSFPMIGTAAPVTPQVQPAAGALSSQPYPYPGLATLPAPVTVPYPLPGQDPLQPVFTPSPTLSPTPTSLPERIEIHFKDLGLLWRECELPRPQNQSQEECLGVTMTEVNEGDSSPFGGTFSPPGGLLPGWRLTIGSDVYEAVHQPYLKKGYSNPDGQSEYKLFKNGQLLMSTNAITLGYDPNVGLLNINGKYAWEFADPDQPTIIYDGMDLRREFGLEAAYRPYIIEGTMIFVARNHGKMFVVADGEQIGPAFDKIYNGYCCETIHIIRSPGQYWFWGTREGRKFAVVITALQ